MAPSKSGAALLKVLESHSAKDIISLGENKEPGVIEIDSESTPTQAARVLWEHNIIGAPVWDAKEKKYVGFFDMRDILSAVTAAGRAFHAEQEAKGGAAPQADDSSDRRSHLKKRHSSLMVTALQEMQIDKSHEGVKVSVPYLAARNPFHASTPDSSLKDVCKAITDRRQHRVPIVPGDDSRCSNIISQSALVKFLSDNVPAGALNEKMTEAGLDYKKKVVSIVDTASASEAFELLDSQRLSGIAVVDEEDGTLVGNTSARDIKHAAIDAGRTTMDQDILSYLASVRQATPTKKDRYPTCHVHEDATVEHVVHLLAKTGYHRVFVVDEERKPIGVVSVADIIRFAVSSV